MKATDYLDNQNQFKPKLNRWLLLSFNEKEVNNDGIWSDINFRNPYYKSPYLSFFYCLFNYFLDFCVLLRTVYYNGSAQKIKAKLHTDLQLEKKSIKKLWAWT